MLALGTSTGGVGTHVRALARDLGARHEVAICAPASTLAHFDLSGSAGITTYEVGISTQMHPRDIALVRALRRHIRDFAPDIIHAHGFRAAFLLLLARGRSGVPVVVSWHNQATARGVKGIVAAGVEAFIARRADLTLGASEDLADRARAVGGKHVQFAPVAAPHLEPVPKAQRHAVRAELLAGQDSRELLCLMVGRISPQKNYELLLAVAARLRDLPVTVAIAGAADSRLLAQLQQQIAATDLGSVTIRFLGPRRDINALMAAADVYVLTSHWEARALVLQEALLAGLPIIASRAGGIPGLVGDAGVLLDPAAPDAAEAFAAAIRTMTDPQVRASWADRARIRARDLPDEEAVAANILGLYAAVLRR